MLGIDGARRGARRHRTVGERIRHQVAEHRGGDLTSVVPSDRTLEHDRDHECGILGRRHTDETGRVPAVPAADGPLGGSGLTRHPVAGDRRLDRSATLHDDALHHLADAAGGRLAEHPHRSPGLLGVVGPVGLGVAGHHPWRYPDAVVGDGGEDLGRLECVERQSLAEQHGVTLRAAPGSGRGASRPGDSGRPMPLWEPRPNRAGSSPSSPAAPSRRAGWCRCCSTWPGRRPPSASRLRAPRRRGS